MRLTLSHPRQVILTLWSPILTLQFMPGTIGRSQSLQILAPSGIGVRVFCPMRLAMEMYLFALSGLPAFTAEIESPYSIDMRSFATPSERRAETRLLDIGMLLCFDNKGYKYKC
jgi:hypothetical protein